jgi:hypothetical protein
MKLSLDAQGATRRWIGATLWGPADEQIWDEKHDLLDHAISPGSSTITRLFLVPATTPPGAYDLEGELWTGPGWVDDEWDRSIGCKVQVLEG